MAVNYAYNYAEIDLETGECVAVMSRSAPIDHPALIPVPTDDDNYIGKYYLNGAWYEDAEGTTPWNP
jgi:hypothetical protein